jgi:hypothetical protein
MLVNFWLMQHRLIWYSGPLSTSSYGRHLASVVCLSGEPMEKRQVKKTLLFKPYFTHGISASQLVLMAAILPLLCV